MTLFDLPLSELRNYAPEILEPDGFDDFWANTLAETDKHPIDIRAERIDNRLRAVETFDLTFAGYGGTDVKAWLHLPVGRSGRLPAVVVYRGYSGGRGMPLDTTFAQAGYAHFVLDTRGQGWSAPSIFDTTPDDDAEAGSTSVPGLMTRGVRNPHTYYYRRLFVDAVRLVRVAATHEAVDASRIVVTGASQGGGVAIAAAGLAPKVGLKLAGCAPDVPFLCHFKRAVDISGELPYEELRRYLATYPQQIDQVMLTLSHFDGANFAPRIACPARFSVALMDQICPPSTVFAAYNRITSAKQIDVYPYNGHEGGTELQLWQQLGWLRELFS